MMMGLQAAYLPTLIFAANNCENEIAKAAASASGIQYALGTIQMVKRQSYLQGNIFCRSLVPRHHAVDQAKIQMAKCLAPS